MPAIVTNVSASSQQILTRVRRIERSFGCNVAQVMDKDEKPPTILGLNVKRLREAKGWGQLELARRAGVSSVAMIENFERQSPQHKTVKAIAGALGVTVDELYDEQGIPAKESPPDPPGLQKLLESPFGKDATDEEKSWLRSLRGHLDPGNSATDKSYYKALEAHRAMKADDESQKAKR